MRYVITGGSGYIGSRLVERLVDRDDVERVTIADIRPPRSFRPKVEFAKLDVRDGAGVRALLERERPDALVHLAFVLNPMHDENTMYEIDVGGTHNVLEAASATGVEHVLVTSSATAYGAFPDNPVTIVRPCIVFGPNVDNYIVRAWTKQPFFAELGGADQPVQFVHEDDVVEALIRLLEGRH